ncbi:MAG: lipid A deacylase LpxR family protein [Arcobacteraceae bacterium]|nr:lipid A deacylase LpxR family protein [Arcobacteraceae bacterium]
MKKIIIIISIMCITISYLYGDTHSLMMDNDAFASKKDAHYTGGLFYTWMDNNKTNPTAISFTYLAFTPDDKNETKAILDDLPYAGYAKLNFLFYKRSKNYFHEFGINMGFIGSLVRGKEVQSEIHRIIGVDRAKGWDNQLDDKLMAGISYSFVKKTDTIDIRNFKFDWTNNIRANIDTFYSGTLISTTFRIGSKSFNTFQTTGNFIGDEESTLLDFSNVKDFHWSISLGFFANKINRYYIVDKAISQGYKLSKLKYITGEQVTYNMFYNNIQYIFKIKSVYLHNNKLLSGASKQWGEFGIKWKF